MNLKEEERRARLLKSRAERLPDIKKQFEEAQNHNFNSNFAPGGKDAKLVKTKKKTAASVRLICQLARKRVKWCTIRGCFLRTLMLKLLSILLVCQ